MIAAPFQSHIMGVAAFSEVFCLLKSAPIWRFGTCSRIDTEFRRGFEFGKILFLEDAYYDTYLSLSGIGSLPWPMAC
jgi:hypothetical protein